MAVDEATQKALDLKDLSVPAGLPVIRLEAENYTDSDGEPALRVWAILDEAAEVEQIKGEAVGQLKLAISDNLIKHGVTAFPYVFMTKASELADVDEE